MSSAYKPAAKFSPPPISPYLDLSLLKTITPRPTTPRRTMPKPKTRGSSAPQASAVINSNNSRATGGGLKVQNSVPYSHLPLPEEPSGLYNLLMTDSDMALTKKKFLKVGSMGQVEVEPDRVEFCIQIQTSKTDATQAKESIKKREDYIMGTLKKCRVSESNIKCTEIVKRIEVEEDDEYSDEPGRTNHGKNRTTDVNGNHKNLESSVLNWRKEICVTCDALIKYMQIYSICMEKLDRHVVISQPVVRFSPEHMQAYTHKTLKLAMDNAVQNAKELLGSMKRRALLGRLYYCVQDTLAIQRIEEYENKNVMSSQFESFNWRKRNKIITCNLTSVFELDYPKPNKPRSAV